IPLTFLAGVYGMNFHDIPELNLSWAYPAFWAVCLGLAGAMLVLFKYRGWLGASTQDSMLGRLFARHLYITYGDQYLAHGELAGGYPLDGDRLRRGSLMATAFCRSVILFGEPGCQALYLNC